MLRPSPREPDYAVKATIAESVSYVDGVVAVRFACTIYFDSIIDPNVGALANSLVFTRTSAPVLLVASLVCVAEHFLQ